MNKNNYIKIIDRNFIYYINKNNCRVLDITNFSKQEEFKLKCMSDVVIDKHNNKILKCRYRMEDLFDILAGVKNEI